MLLLLALGGCAGASVAVQPTELPIPLVEPLPINIGIHLSDELLKFAHTEELAKNGTWRIDIGSAQSLMFENLAAGMFTGHRLITELPTQEKLASGVDAVLVPSISQLQFAIPAQTRSSFFEVWIKYQFQLVRADGSAIAEWPLQAYGKANSHNYGFMEDTANGALQEAARVALRDAMAFFALKFKRVPAISQWLQQLKQSTTLPQVPLQSQTQSQTQPLNVARGK
jgi:hypothetical protein